MRKTIGAALSGALSIGLAGCATVLNGTSQPVELQSEPAGAQAVLVTGLKCETPCTYSLKRGKDNVVTFTKQGYRPEQVYIQSRTGGSVFGNAVAGGIVGGVIDGSNGAANHLYPDPVFVKLAPVGSSEAALLLDKKGRVISTVAEHNAKVEKDVNKGLDKQGLRPMGTTEPPAPAP